MKLDRLLAITMLLLNRKRISAKELADRFEVSMRTIYRDVEAVQLAGVPVVSYAGIAGGYEIAERYRLDRQFLSMEDFQSIIIALRGIRATMDDRYIGSLLDKVGALLAKPEQDKLAEAASRLVIDINPWGSGLGEQEKMGKLRDAIRDDRIVKFTYTSGDGEQSGRSCEPMRLILKGYAWYLSGYCLLRNDFRTFRLSRIRGLELTERTFVRRDDPPQAETLRWRRGNPSEIVHLLIRFAPGARAKVEDYFDSEQVRTEPGGDMLVRSVQPDEPWLYGFLLGFGADAHVLEPVEVARKLREKAAEILKLYPER